jgi:Zn-dependent protease
MFYKLDSTRVTLKEYWWGTPNPLVIFGWLAKWLRIKLPGSVDDPNVESLEPFRVAPADLPEEARAKFHAVHEELAACGFHSPVCYRIHDAVHQTDIYQAVYLHEAGQAFARVHHRVWSFPKPPREYFFPTFVSSFTDGSYLVTTAGKPDMLAPPSCQVVREVGAPAGRLWELHQRTLDERPRAAAVVPVRDADELAAAVEAHHRVVRDFHIERGVFVPMTAEEEASAMAAAKPTEAAEPELSRNAAVLAEIERSRKKKGGWLQGVLILTVSLALFFGIGSTWWSWEFVLLLIGILFLHEMGHYLAMRMFRYRNVRMFFIPLLGAAVSGQHYNVPGWKKTIVSLMGPLPGIILGAAAGVAGLVAGWEPLVQAAILALILNGFNLLPIIPLDGGWIMHSLFFSRHYMLDAGFRLLAVAGLMLGALAIGDSILFFLGLFMLMGLPTAFRMVRVVETLRSRRVATASPDDQSIPPETASAIVDEVRRTFPQSLTNKNVAQLAVQAFEALNARPPGWVATLLLAGVHLGSFLFALVFVGVLVIAQHTDLGDFFSAAVRAPRNPVDPESIQVRHGADAPEVPAPEKTIVANVRSASEAEAAFDRLAGEIPPDATLVRFGKTLLLAIPADDDAAREQWFARLEREAADVHVSFDLTGASVRMMAIAPQEETAVRIERAMRAYLGADPSMHLIPPWHPELGITAKQERARAMYAKLLDTVNVYDDPEVLRIQKQIGEAYRRGDDERARELQEQMQQLVQRSQEEHLHKLQREASDPVEAEVVALFGERPMLDFDAPAAAGEEGEEEEEATSQAPAESEAETQAVEAHSEAAQAAQEQATEDYNRQYADWARRMGERLGQLPMEGDDVKPGERRFSASGGVVTRTGLIVQADFLRFDRLVDGPPALVRWWSDQGCADPKYEFVAGF